MKKVIFLILGLWGLMSTYSENLFESYIVQQGVSGTSTGSENDTQRKDENLLNTQQLNSTTKKNNSFNTPTPTLWENFLEIGLTQVSKTKKKDPEDLGSILNSIRIANQFQNNQATFSLQQTEIVEKKPKKTISYTVSPEKSKFFINFTYKFFDNKLEYRRYYDTSENFTLDTIVTDYRESKIKFGSGPLDFFTNSAEASFYFFKIETKGIYEVQTRQVPQQEVFLPATSTLNFFFYNYIRPSSTPFSYIYGNNKITTSGFGGFGAFNTKFWKIFSFYNIYDISFFKIKANLYNLSPSYEFYNQITRRNEYVPQIINVKKNLDSNMLFYYELGFSVTVGQIGLKWGIYLTMPLLLDVGVNAPKGYIVTLTEPIQFKSLEQEIKIFYKGDPSNRTQKEFDIILGGITFGAVSKF